MTREDIEKLEAGPELDAIIAEKVMGLRPCKFTMIASIAGGPDYWKCQHEHPFKCYPIDPNGPRTKYSENISAAWQVVEKMSKKGYGIVIEEILPKKVSVYFIKRSGELPGFQGKAEKVELAICRAALLAVMEGK